MQQQDSDEQKENITLRFSKQVLDDLRFEANQRNVSVNAAVQEIVTEHYEWSGKAPKAGMIPVHKSVLAMLMDKVSDEDIAEIARLFAQTKVKDVLLVLRRDYSLAAFLDMFESWLKSRSILFGKELRNDRYSYVIHHDLGNKWSLFLSTLIRSVLVEMGVVNPSFQVTDNVIMFDVPLEHLEQAETNT